jgi:hypothetical protein
MVESSKCEAVTLLLASRRCCCSFGSEAVLGGVSFWRTSGDHPESLLNKLFVAALDPMDSFIASAVRIHAPLSLTAEGCADTRPESLLTEVSIVRSCVSISLVCICKCLLLNLSDFIGYSDGKLDGISPIYFEKNPAKTVAAVSQEEIWRDSNFELGCQRIHGCTRRSQTRKR